MPSIKFGMFPNTQGTPDGKNLQRMVQLALAEAQVAERYDFDGVFLTEHHQAREGYLPSPLITASAIAAKTERVAVGTAVLLLPLYHPVHVAEEAAVVDLISNGRLILGVGLGYQEQDFQAFGVPMNERVSRFEEGVEILRGAWSQDDFNYSGRRYQIENLSLVPKPVQQPAPIWIGASSNAAIERAGRLGDCWITNPMPKSGTVKRQAEAFRQASAAAGQPGQIALLREAWVAPTAEAAREEYGAAVLETHRYYYRHGGYYQDVPTEADLTFERVADGRLIIGSPDDCIRQIEEWHEATGAEWFLLRFSHPSGPANEKVLAAMRLFGQKVIPHFR